MPVHRIIAILVVLVLSIQIVSVAAAQDEDKTYQLIEACMPTRTLAEPKKERKLLVFSRCEGFAHASIPTCETTIRLMAEKTGAFSPDFSREMNAFTPENLNRYDAVLFNNTTRLKFENPEHRKALLQFVRNGKGVIGIHAATDNFYEWPEAAAMMGGLFDGHPWGAGGTWAVKIDEPDHPLNRGFAGKGFLIKDEIYQIKGPYSRDTHRVLLSLDMSNPRNSKVKGIKRKDNDFAISWLREFGKGRVFYCSLGHNHEVFWNRSVLRHYLDGIQYALGDLPADATPSARLESAPKPALTTFADVDKDDPIAALESYEFSHSRLPLSTIEEKIRNTNPEEMPRIEARLIEILNSPAATFAGKQFACRMLRRAGSDISIPVLEKLLYDEKLTDAARFALQGSPSREADAVLLRALDRLEGDARIGVISTMAQRGGSLAVPRLGELAASYNVKLSEAAISALGRIGGSEAARILKNTPVIPRYENLRNAARLQCADSLFEKGLTSAAASICRELTDKSCYPPTRVAAYRGLVLNSSGNPSGLILTLLRDSDPFIRQAGGKFIGEVPQRTKLNAILEEITTLPHESQVLVLAGFTARDDKAVLPAAVHAADSSSDEVRIAAFRALKIFGGADQVELLARAAVEKSPAGREASRCLDKLSAHGVDEKIMKCLPKAEDPVRAELIRCLSVRKPDGAMAVFLAGAMDDNAAVRGESLKALEKQAGRNELADLIGLLPRARDAAHRRGVEKAVLSACRRTKGDDKRIGPLLAAHVYADDPATRASLVRLLGQLPCADSLPPLIAGLKDSSAEVRDSATRALIQWPDAAPMNEVCRIAVDTGKGEIHRLALEGYIRMAGLPSDRPPAEARRIFETAMAAAADHEEQTLVLNGVSNVVASWALDFVKPYQKDEALRVAAAVAASKIRRALARTVSHDACNCAVTLDSPFDAQYTGGGQNALTDGKWGSKNHGDGRWQGFKGSDLEATIDFGRVIEVRSIRTAFVENTKSWIFPPEEVSFWLSTDGVIFHPVAKMHKAPAKEIKPASIHDFFKELDNQPARYLRVHAKSVKTCPEWHPGSGGTAWLFADEIQVNPHLIATQVKKDATPW